MNEIDTPTPSPCIRNCCLNDFDVCLGCFRSLEEIKEWGVVGEQRRRSILLNAERRKAANLKEPIATNSTP